MSDSKTNFAVQINKIFPHFSGSEKVKFTKVSITSKSVSIIEHLTMVHEAEHNFNKTCTLIVVGATRGLSPESTILSHSLSV